MKKIKLTQLSKDELKRVAGGFEASAKKCGKCKCGTQQVFGLQDSKSMSTQQPR